MKKYSDSTLKGFTKDFLINIIRCLENNIKGCEERNKNQYRRLCQMYSEIEKYKWHNLRKNPNDLPSLDEVGGRGYLPCIVYIDYGDFKSIEYTEYTFLEGFGYYFFGVSNDKVIAWKYEDIELLEEEEL